MNAPLVELLVPYFQEYEQYLKEADALFLHMQKNFPEELSCKKGCDACCYALFDVQLIEALYINARFSKNIPFGELRSQIIERANKIDRQVAKIKQQAQKEQIEGKESALILQEFSSVRLPCPLLANTSQCQLYEYRPVICRLYGIPLLIGDTTRSCGKTHFLPQKRYPTVFLDKIQKKIYALNQRLCLELRSSYQHLSSMLVPLSSALLTEYTEGFLGLPQEEQKNE